MTMQSTSYSTPAVRVVVGEVVVAIIIIVNQNQSPSLSSSIRSESIAIIIIVNQNQSPSLSSSIRINRHHYHRQSESIVIDGAGATLSRGTPSSCLPAGSSGKREQTHTVDTLTLVQPEGTEIRGRLHEERVPHAPV
jgi:hypothetical protein